MLRQIPVEGYIHRSNRRLELEDRHKHTMLFSYHAFLHLEKAVSIYDVFGCYILILGLNKKSDINKANVV